MTILVICSGREDHEWGQDKGTQRLAIGAPCGFGFRSLRRCSRRLAARLGRQRAWGAQDERPDGFPYVSKAGPAQTSMLRKRPGVTPIPRRKMEVRWLWSTNPSSSTIQARDWCVRRIRVCVRQSTLYHLTQRPNPGHFFEVVGAQTGDVGEHGERKSSSRCASTQSCTRRSRWIGKRTATGKLLDGFNFKSLRRYSHTVPG